MALNFREGEKTLVAKTIVGFDTEMKSTDLEALMSETEGETFFGLAHIVINN
jgi:hypothetical protein